MTVTGTVGPRPQFFLGGGKCRFEPIGKPFLFPRVRARVGRLWPLRRRRQIPPTAPIRGLRSEVRLGSHFPICFCGHSPLPPSWEVAPLGIRQPPSPTVRVGSAFCCVGVCPLLHFPPFRGKLPATEVVEVTPSRGGGRGIELLEISPHWRGYTSPSLSKLRCVHPPWNRNFRNNELGPERTSLFCRPMTAHPPPRLGFFF